MKKRHQHRHLLWPPLVRLPTVSEPGAKNRHIVASLTVAHPKFVGVPGIEYSLHATKGYRSMRA